MGKKENDTGADAQTPSASSLTPEQQLAELEKVLKEVEAQLNMAEQKTKQELHAELTGPEQGEQKQNRKKNGEEKKKKPQKNAHAEAAPKKEEKSSKQAEEEAVPKEEEKSSKQAEEETAPGKPRNWQKHLNRFLLIADVFLLLYFIAVFSKIPFVVKWRTLYIETAMSTTSHQWLATAFIPGSIIDAVMEQRNLDAAKQQLLDSGWEDAGDSSLTDEKDFYSVYWELDTPEVRAYLTEYLDTNHAEYDSILIEDFEETLGLKTVHGDPVLVLDTKNHLMIIGVKGDEYVGKMAFIKNPKQVTLAKSEYLGSRGEIVDVFGEKNDALLAVNASGFKDVEGHGSGGQVRGSLVIDGVDYGDHASGKSHWKFIGMQEDHRLYITSYDLATIEDYKWAVEFSPALIVNGEIVAEGSFGWGIQPRTAIGQAQDGTFMILLVDGRQIGYSVGCTVGECAIILNRYQAYQAVNLDGGSSSVMWYKDRQITKSSSPSGFGRYLPDAIVVKKAAQNAD